VSLLAQSSSLPEERPEMLDTARAKVLASRVFVPPWSIGADAGADTCISWTRPSNNEAEP
jgi:hypothetical protein